MTTFTANPSFISAIGAPGSAWGYPSPTHMMMLGEDGKHYVIHRTQVDPVSATENTFLLCIEDGTRTQLDGSDAGFGVDVEALFPTSAAIWASITHFPNISFGIPGTPFFYLVRGYFAGALGDDVLVACVRYKINSSGVVEADGGVCNRADVRNDYAPTQVNLGPSQVVGNSHYFAYQTTVANGAKCYLVELPSSGTIDDPTVGTWEARSTRLLDGLFTNVTSTRVTGCAGGIAEYDGNVGVLFYVSQGHIDDSSPECPEIAAIGSGGDPRLWFIKDNVAPIDLSADFGVPLDDTLKHYDGTTDASAYKYANDYVGPSTAVGNDGIWYAFLTRGYTEKAEYLRLRISSIIGNTIASIVDEQVRYVDTVSDLGELPANRDIAYGYSYHLGYDAATSRLMVEMELNDVDQNNGSLPDLKVFSWLGLFAAAPDGELFETADLEEVAAELELDPVDAIAVQRWLVETGHIRFNTRIGISDLKLTLKRGIGTNTDAPRIWVRVNRDNKGFGKWVKKSLGRKGDRILILNCGGFGMARDWQFQFATTDECAIELRKCQALVGPMEF